MKAVELENIVKKYDGVPVLDIEKFEMQQGEHVALVGPNGSGKTTLLNIIAMIDRPSSGNINMMGKKVISSHLDEMRKFVTIVAQEPYFFTGSLKKNMQFALEQVKKGSREKWETSLDILKVLELDELMSRSPRTFSSGELKRAAIARALAIQPSILLLDEPFANIDVRSASILEKVLLGLPKEQSLIFTTHELSNAYKMSTRVVTLQNGKMSPWTPENIFKVKSQPVEDGTDLVLESGLSIYYPDKLEDGKIYTVSIDARQVILSREPIESSAQNSFSGDLKKIESVGENLIAYTIECAPDFTVRATVTTRTLEDFKSTVGDRVWVHFKSAAIYLPGR